MIANLTIRPRPTSPERSTVNVKSRIPENYSNGTPRKIKIQSAQHLHNDTLVGKAGSLHDLKTNTSCPSSLSD